MRLGLCKLNYNPCAQILLCSTLTNRKAQTVPKSFNMFISIQHYVMLEVSLYYKNDQFKNQGTHQFEISGAIAAKLLYTDNHFECFFFFVFSYFIFVFNHFIASKIEND